MRARETGLCSQLDALAAQLVDREAYLKFATGLEDFLGRLHENATAATVAEQQRVLRLLVEDVLASSKPSAPTSRSPQSPDITTPTSPPREAQRPATASAFSGQIY